MNDFNWNEFYSLAKHLNDDYSFHCQEAVQRTIVSRAYYAAFGMAKEVLEHKYKNFIPQDSTSHKYVRIEYKKQGREDISDFLRDLRKYRNCCDYNKNLNDLHELVNLSLQKSEYIINSL